VPVPSSCEMLRTLGLNGWLKLNTGWVSDSTLLEIAGSLGAITEPVDNIIEGKNSLIDSGILNSGGQKTKTIPSSAKYHHEDLCVEPLPEIVLLFCDLSTNGLMSLLDCGIEPLQISDEVARLKVKNSSTEYAPDAKTEFRSIRAAVVKSQLADQHCLCIDSVFTDLSVLEETPQLDLLYKSVLNRRPKILSLDTNDILLFDNIKFLHKSPIYAGKNGLSYRKLHILSSELMQ